MKTLFKSVLVAILFATSIESEAQVPPLSSLPSAQAVIFIDFDGHNVTGTAWNYNGPILCAASGLDNAQITTTFERVAEDYRPFNVNVTTDSTKYLAAPVDKRVRVIVTTNWQWYGAAGGVAMIGSFTWGDDTPCFVFSSQLGTNPKNIAEAVSHEAGHTLSLQHQSVYDVNCVKTSEYNYGAGAGEIGWAPIMGVGYYQNLTTWNIGKNSVSCSTIQDDVTIITSQNGFGLRPDENAGDFATATYVPFTGNQFSTSALLTQTNDQDMFRITLPANGRFVFDASPYNVGSQNSGSNLDLQVSFYNGSHTLLNSYNPSDLLNASIDTQLNAGVYYLRVEGASNIYAPSWGNLGEYVLTGNFTLNTLPLHKLELTGQVIADQHKLNWVIEADEQVIKQVLESSVDGIHFAALKQNSIFDRTYLYKPNSNSAVQYRLNVTFDNGRQYYSNVVQLHGVSEEVSPKLVGNMSTGSLSVSSPGIYNYSLFEMSGRMVRNGTLTEGVNNLSTLNLNKGLYIIRFTNGAAQWTEKFIRQ